MIGSTIMPATWPGWVGEDLLDGVQVVESHDQR